MKKPVMLIFLNTMILIVVFALLAQSLFVVQRLAQVQDVRGIVEVQRGGQGEWNRLVAGQTVAPNDVVRTGTNGQIAFLWADKTRWRLMPGAQLTIASATTNSAQGVENARFKLDEGKLFVRIVKPQRAGSSFRVQTPGAIATATGTVFSVEAMPGGATGVESYAGQVQLESDGHQATIMAGTAGVTAPDSIALTPNSGAAFRAMPDLIQPTLTVSALKVHDSQVWIHGATEAGDALEINGWRALVLGNGTFARRFTLLPGHNQWQIAATDKHGARTLECRALDYNASSGESRESVCQ